MSSGRPATGPLPEENGGPAMYLVEEARNLRTQALALRQRADALDTLASGLLDRAERFHDGEPAVGSSRR